MTVISLGTNWRGESEHTSLSSAKRAADKARRSRVWRAGAVYIRTSPGEVISAWMCRRGHWERLP